MTATNRTAVTGTYRLDPVRTRIGFSVRSMGVKVQGSFETFGGSLHLDADSPERSSVEVTVDVTSMNTRNARRDRHLSAAFFDAADHPQIAYRSTSIHRLTGDRLRLTGQLTLNGRTGPLAIDVTAIDADALDVTPDGDVRAVFEGRATLSRKDWGVTWNAALEGGGLFVSDRVVIELEVGAIRAR